MKPEVHSSFPTLEQQLSCLVNLLCKCKQQSKNAISNSLYEKTNGCKIHSIHALAAICVIFKLTKACVLTLYPKQLFAIGLHDEHIYKSLSSFCFNFKFKSDLGLFCFRCIIRRSLRQTYFCTRLHLWHLVESTRKYISDHFSALSPWGRVYNCRNYISNRIVLLF